MSTPGALQTIIDLARYDLPEAVDGLRLFTQSVTEKTAADTLAQTIEFLPGLSAGLGPKVSGAFISDIIATVQNPAAREEILMAGIRAIPALAAQNPLAASVMARGVSDHIQGESSVGKAFIESGIEAMKGMLERGQGGHFHFRKLAAATAGMATDMSALPSFLSQAVAMVPDMARHSGRLPYEVTGEILKAGEQRGLDLRLRIAEEGLKSFPAIAAKGHQEAGTIIALLSNILTEDESHLRGDIICAGVKALKTMPAKPDLSATVDLAAALSHAAGDDQDMRDAVNAAGRHVLNTISAIDKGAAADMVVALREPFVHIHEYCPLPVITPEFARVAVADAREGSAVVMLSANNCENPAAGEKRIDVTMAGRFQGSLCEFREAMEGGAPSLVKDLGRGACKTILLHADTFERVAAGHITPDQAAQTLMEQDRTHYVTMAL